MKKLFFFATAALVLASCNNDVTISENTALVGSNTQKEIALSSYAQTPKRAAWNGGTNFPGDGDGYGIKLAAYDATKSGLYFDDASYTWSSGTGASIIYHDATTPRYWPFTEAWIHFLGVSYMTTAADNVITTDFSDYDTDGTAAVTLADNSTKQNDLMYGIGNGHVQQVGNALIFPENVPMVFHHALAYLGFRVKANVADAINVTSIVVNDAYEEGVFNITHTGYNNQSATENVNTVSWDVSGATAGDYTVPGTNFGNLQTTFSDEKGLLVVPIGANSFASFTINYQLNNVDYAYTYEPTSLTLDKQKKYLYDISFTMHEILVNATVTDWDDETPTTHVDVPMESYAHNAEADNTGNFPKTGTIPATAGTYSFCVTGLQSTDNVTVAAGTGGTGTLTSVTHVYNTTTKVATVTFEVPANAANTAKTYVIDITDSGTSGSTHKTTITVNQEAAE